MSDKTKSSLEKAVLAIAVVSFLYTVAKAVVFLPRDVEDLRAKVEAARTDHDLLQRIDERTAAMSSDIKELKHRP